MAGIFISYRRDDSPGDARSIYEGLAGRFGRANVFMDVDNLLAGQRFDRELNKALGRCAVLIAVIGPRWMDLLSFKTRDGERDYVREEIATALKRDIAVIPVRVGQQGGMPALPRTNDLPPDIRDLVLHQKHDVAHERFGRDLADLVAAIRLVQRGERRPVPRKAIGIAVAAALLLTGGVALFQSGVLEQVAMRDPALAVTPGSGRSFRDRLVNGAACPLCPEMVVAPAGAFTMGSLSNEDGHSAREAPQRKVTFRRPLAVGKFEVTVDQFAAFVDATRYDAGSKCNEQAGLSFRNPGYPQTGSHPAACVSWNDAEAYVDWLSKQTGKPYRLLTEAEWEYAARAGSTTAYSWGGGIGKGNANCFGCGSQWDAKQTAPVGSFAANALGLHDVHGNVSEWVEDCWNASYKNTPSDGSAWTAGECESRVLRGGSWDNDPRNLRSANRFSTSADFRFYDLGFRVARTLLTP
jgi:formylglycine-generating enzyme required for sulfatase activity